MRAATRLLALLSIAACGGDDDGTGPEPTVPRIDGTAWDLEAEYGNTQLDVSCALSGTISFTQSGDNITGGQIAGREVCAGPGGTTDVNISQPVASGDITQAGRVTFNTTAEGVTCELDGQFAEDEFGQAIEGSVDCSSEAPLTGSFTAQR